MSDIQYLFERHAEWQRNRRRLSWPEKIHMAEELQKSLRQLRKSKDRLPHAPEDSQEPRKPESV